MRGSLNSVLTAVTLLLIAALSSVFIKGTHEAVRVAVLIVATYLALNLVVVGNGLVCVNRFPN